MTRGWKIGIGVVGALIAVNLLLRLLGSFTGGTPGGPDGSSYATGPDGVAAFATLLGRAGRRVDAVRDLPHRVSLDSRETVVLLDPDAVANRDAEALLRFVRSGGTLVAGGSETGWLRVLLRSAPGGDVAGSRFGRAGRLRLETLGGRVWRRPGPLRPLARSGAGVLAGVAHVGSGRVIALADTSPLQNRLLGHADNAAFALRLTAAHRDVAFLESYHGYGRSSGLAALPLAWKLLLPGLALAALVYMVARGRRFGPAERPRRDLPPPRREYVDALAAVLARTPRAQALARVRAHARTELLRRTALPPDAGDAETRTAARRIGLDDAEIEALLGGDDPLALGRSLARIGQDPR